MKTQHAIYCHIPFCIRRCAYCDFNTYSGQEAFIDGYVDALCREIEITASAAHDRYTVGSVYFGGGTPSLLTTRQFKQILKSISEHFILEKAEISLEANPGTLTLDALHELHCMGFTRISVGVQSFNPEELLFLERIHDAFSVFDVISNVRRSGFRNLNLDLIFGLPHQTIKKWEYSLRQAVSQRPEHISLYALTIEKGTPFGRWVDRGLMPLPDPDTAASMYEFATSILMMNGYEQYEISNWSIPGFSCHHNLHIWRNQPYLGFGAGAHGYANGVRYANVRRIRTYIERLNIPNAQKDFPLSPAVASFVRIDRRTEMQETMLLGLRLTREGVNATIFQERYGVSLDTEFSRELDKLTQLGLLEWEGDIIRLTERGRLLGNRVFVEFVDGKD